MLETKTKKELKERDSKVDVKKEIKDDDTNNKLKKDGEETEEVEMKEEKN